MNLSVRDVSKQYKGNKWALENFSLELESGVLGLLGPNGAGKSTLMKIISTITQPTSGVITWNDQDVSKNPDAIRDDLGYLPQDFGVYPHLTAVEFLEYIAAIKGVDSKMAKSRIMNLLQLVHLYDVRNRAIGGYSGGMVQRIGIAQALLNDPKLLIVDEPTVGLDPQERIYFKNLISDLAGERVVIYSTHIVTDVESIATSIAIISGGKLLVHTSPEQLLLEVEKKVWECVIPSAKINELKDKWLIGNSIRRSDGVHVRVVSDKAPMADSRKVEPSLEDAYLYYMSTNRGL